eukprot:PLAT9158.2.p1 GENE.PLAT9158.2~~PLAT9158.2.p1  ORF type:complete len:265 (+),score=62.16 PLAT9158.2:49-795(+)
MAGCLGFLPVFLYIIYPATTVIAYRSAKCTVDASFYRQESCYSCGDNPSAPCANKAPCVELLVSYELNGRSFDEQLLLPDEQLELGKRACTHFVTCADIENESAAEKAALAFNRSHPVGSQLDCLIPPDGRSLPIVNRYWRPLDWLLALFVPALFYAPCLLLCFRDLRRRCNGEPTSTDANFRAVETTVWWRAVGPAGSASSLPSLGEDSVESGASPIPDAFESDDDSEDDDDNSYGDNMPAEAGLRV